MMRGFFVGFLLFVSCHTRASTVDYDKLKQKIEESRLEIYEQYKTGNNSQRDSLILLSRNYLFNTLVNDVFTAWYGTRWEFNGHTKTPQKGAIACGYFITTTLQDVGFKIPRIKWAQMASEPIIRKMTTDIKRFHNAEMKNIIKYINNKGDGLYIVGLDQHVGFISKKGEKLRFIHSNYYRPEAGVMEEVLEGWNPLNYSKYRVIGKILENEMIERWITGYEWSN